MMVKVCAKNEQEKRTGKSASIKGEILLKEAKSIPAILLGMRRISLPLSSEVSAPTPRSAPQSAEKPLLAQRFSH